MTYIYNWLYNRISPNCPETLLQMKKQQLCVCMDKTIFKKNNTKDLPWGKNLAKIGAFANTTYKNIVWLLSLSSVNREITNLYYNVNINRFSLGIPILWWLAFNLIRNLLYLHVIRSLNIAFCKRRLYAHSLSMPSNIRITICN